MLAWRRWHVLVIQRVPLRPLNSASLKNLVFILIFLDDMDLAAQGVGEKPHLLDRLVHGLYTEVELEPFFTKKSGRRLQGRGVGLPFTNAKFVHLKFFELPIQYPESPMCVCVCEERKNRCVCVCAPKLFLQ